VVITAEPAATVAITPIFKLMLFIPMDPPCPLIFVVASLNDLNKITEPVTAQQSAQIDCNCINFNLICKNGKNCRADNVAVILKFSAFEILYKMRTAVD
jgi:hypothetical protein